MPYIGCNKYCSDISTAYTHIISKLVSMGWTLHDNISAQNKVYKSNGEDNVKLYGYIKVYVSGSYIYFFPYLQWDATTHAGSSPVYGSGYNFTWSSAGMVGVYGDKDLVAVKISTNLVIFGHIPYLFIAAPKAILQADALQGASISVTVDSTSGFGVSRYYMIVGQNYEGRDKIQITSITDSTHMIIASLPRNYQAGSVVSPLPIAFGLTSTGSSFGSMNPVAHPDFSGTDTGTAGSIFAVKPLLSELSSITGPDGINGTKFILSSICFSMDGTTKSAALGVASGNILTVQRGVAVDDVIGVSTGTNIPISGQCTETATSNTLTNTNANWIENANTGMFVYISAGSGAGQIRSIASNTATTLTVGDAWTTVPDVSSTYKIVDATWRVIYVFSSSYYGIAALESTFS